MAAAPKNKQRLKVNIYGITETFPTNRDDWKVEEIPSMTLLDFKKKIIARYVRLSDANDKVNLQPSDLTFKIHGQRIDATEKEANTKLSETPSYVGDMLFMDVVQRDDLVLPSRLQVAIENSQNLSQIGKFLVNKDNKQKEAEMWTMKIAIYEDDDEDDDDSKETGNSGNLDISNVKQVEIKNNTLVGHLRETIFNKLCENEANKKSSVMNGKTKNNIRLHFNYGNWVLRCDAMEVRHMAKIRNGDTIFIGLVSEKGNDVDTSGNEEALPSIGDLGFGSIVDESDLMGEYETLALDATSGISSLPLLTSTPAPSAIDND